MRALVAILLSFLVLIHAGPARADVSGPACVTSGDTLVIDGKRRFGRCRGGRTVRLFGLIAPEPKQLCPGPKGRAWHCGRASAAALLDWVKGRTVVCKGNSWDRARRLLAVCSVDGRVLNRRLVAEGWALAHPRHSRSYEPAEARARAALRGLWQDPNLNPDWRDADR